MRSANMHSRGPVFFFLWRWEKGVGFFFQLFCSQYVPIEFPMSLQHVSQVPISVPNSTSLCPICFSVSFTLITCIKQLKGRHYKRYIYFGTVQSLTQFLCDGLNLGENTSLLPFFHLYFFSSSFLIWCPISAKLGLLFPVLYWRL
jgi:hypothetical protein